MQDFHATGRPKAEPAAIFELDDLKAIQVAFSTLSDC